MNIAFPPKCSCLTDKRTNICIYRVDSLLKIHVLNYILLTTLQERNLIRCPEPAGIYFTILYAKINSQITHNS